MEECGEEVRIVYLDRKLDEDVLISKIGLLQAVAHFSFARRVIRGERTHFSVVNLFSLYAAINWEDSLKARRLRAPCELLLTSCTKATVLSLRSFW